MVTDQAIIRYESDANYIMWQYCLDVPNALTVSDILCFDSLKPVLTT